MGLVAIRREANRIQVGPGGFSSSQPPHILNLPVTRGTRIEKTHTHQRAVWLQVTRCESRQM